MRLYKKKKRILHSFPMGFQPGGSNLLREHAHDGFGGGLFIHPVCDNPNLTILGNGLG